MPRKQIAAITAASLAALTACSSSGSSSSAGGSLVRVNAARATVGQADLSAASAGVNAFGVDVFHSVADGDEGNVMISPTSLATVLTMLLPGAKGQTEAQMAKALHTTMTADQFADALGALDSATVQRELADKAELQQYDTVWTQKGYDIQPSYLQTLASAFDAGVRETDFTNSESARQTINKTVEDQTNGLIKDLFGPGSISPATRLALTDSLYLKAKWADAFAKSATSDKPFHLTNGSTANVPTMGKEHSFAYAHGADWQYAELPYQQDHLAMGILLPASGSFDTFRKSLTGDSLATMTASATPSPVDLELPKFTFDTSRDLKSPLESLGMQTVFDPNSADLSGVPAKPESLFVGAVVQKTHVAVDEDGTTAAAASGVTVVAGAAPQQSPPAEMHVDRPFLFLIRDTVTGQILFLGQVSDPRG
ncbi:proteinase inhibitor I4 serpin [Catenulispora acidiphila DSM 44928]|uniref:Proteinase inhibitor I4 serpin n=1 Tax=Catenulispora acidiphila (strain DSM 44928 / JCM 14897 / NBRC 102108 / NRRL B-24433 / ID139908) TaxID=479433 RepID=C7QHC0_CATAD|nr:serpin family protein [Catenulispora acidiphila]ACU69059.1 proteinase inhibitor I4 serpin [Catenulispora acidiphila DSM 44928]